MNSDPSKLRQQQEQIEQVAEARLEQTAAQEFASTEELIRADLAQTPAPERIAERLKDSLSREPKKDPSWWQRLFRRNK